MNRIKKLEAHVANKIAAGEVITEPVNVVKELVENSLDANCTELRVEIQRGGLQSIIIIDDGDGIHSKDVALLFERHATSKMEEAKDLYRIQSFGFRGEALASISAISKVQIYSRHLDEMQGFHITRFGHNLLGNERIMRDKGTRIEVEDLFYNTPVRENFLEKEARLERHVTEFIQAIAIGHPDVSMSYFIDDKLIFQTKGDGDKLKTIYEVFGQDLARNLISIDLDLPQGTVRGFISNLQFSKATRNHQYFYINGRYVSVSPFDKSLQEAYDGLLMVRRFPVCFLWFDLPYDSVDVNIHPRKLEVRIRQEEQLSKSLAQKIREKLRKKDLIYKVEKPLPQSLFPKETYEPIDFSQISYEKVEETKAREYEESIENPVQKTKEVFDYEGFLNKLHYVGQIFASFLVYESGETLYLMDQHAAHEKILYERFLTEWKKQTLTSQILLMPFTLEVSFEEARRIDLEELRTLGFDIEGFSENKLVIREIPHIFEDIEARAFLESFLGEQMHHKETLIMNACKAAIKANRRLDVIEQSSLLDQLITLDDPFTCPHGRPIFIEISRREIEKRFERI